ncbi:MAG: hypothetical protein ABR555_11445 [Pyrinomonadaceae bacterium]
MSQLITLTWLKLKLLRNSLRSSRAVANQLATVLGLLLALTFALAVATGLGLAAYALTRPNAVNEIFRQSASRSGSPTVTAEFVFFSILAFLYLMWATVPLSLGSSKQFDAGRLLMYPISLRKLFAVDFLSEITTLQSVFAIPAIVAIGVGAGLGSGNLGATLIVVIPAAVFGIALSKWLTTTIGNLVRRKRARGETILALVGAIAGLGGALAGQVAPLLFRHAESFTALRWTPPGAAAFALTHSQPQASTSYLLALFLLSAYAIVLIVATYWIARRSALGIGGQRKRKSTPVPIELSAYAGWHLPLVSEATSAVVEKELRYATRNAQLRMMSLMPLILIVIRLVNSRRFGTSLRSGAAPGTRLFLIYGSGLLATGGVLYVFLILAGLSCNQFAFEEGGMRALILSPVNRRNILIGKNIAITSIAFIFSAVLLTINALVFRDLTLFDLLFAGLTFLSFAALMSMIGNWFSIRFPKRMQFGKRLNVSGVAGLLVIPMMLLLAAPPLLATVVGFYTRSLVFEYVTLALFAVALIVFYFLIIRIQGRSLARREIDILEAVKEPTD